MHGSVPLDAPAATDLHGSACPNGGRNGSRPPSGPPSPWVASHSMTDTPPGARLASPDDAQNARRRGEHDAAVDASLPGENAPAEVAGPARDRRTGRAGVPAGV